MALALFVSFFVPDADAARLGSGKSFGKQSSTVTRQQSASPQPATPSSQQAAKPAQPPATAPVPAPAPMGNRWLGPVAGLAAGLGIAALLSHFGLGGAMAEAMGSALLIGLLLVAGVFLWQMLRRSTAAPAGAEPMRPAYATPEPVTMEPIATRSSTPVSGQQVSVMGTPLSASSPSSAGSDANWNIPADFDVAGFERSAKVHFIRLQAAWDAKNLADIREFTTPEVFAEIRMQMEEQRGAASETDVADLEATLLGIETGADDYLASVRFTGRIREGAQGEAAPFEEVWNLARPVNGRGGWLLAGIQQLH